MELDIIDQMKTTLAEGYVWDARTVMVPFYLSIPLLDS